jgi:hypothetical protein
VVVQRFGAGRSAALAIGDLFQAGNKYEEAPQDLGKIWRQMLRWLIADVPKRIEVRSEEGAESVVNIDVRARNEKFEPLENAQVRLAIVAPGGSPETNRITLAAEPSEREAGVYRATYVPRESGPYRVIAEVSDIAGVRVGEEEGGWVSEPLAREFASLSPNRELVAEIARKTGGEVVPIGRVEGFVEGLKRKKAPIVETHSYPLWHKSSFFMLALACFATEWGMRRWKGLA